jgi:hypothetical protein
MLIAAQLRSRPGNSHVFKMTTNDERPARTRAHANLCIIKRAAGALDAAGRQILYLGRKRNGFTISIELPLSRAQFTYKMPKLIPK